MFIVTGQTGCGKTSLLRHLVTRCPPKFTPIYHDCSETPASDFSMAKLLERRALFGLVRKRLTSADNVVLFCDEVQKLGSDKAEEIKSHFDSGILRAVVLSTIDELNVVDSMRSRVAGRIMVAPLAPEAVADIIEKRLQAGINPFTRDALLEIAVKSSGNPRLALLNTERLLKGLIATHAAAGSINPELVTLHLGRRQAVSDTRSSDLLTTPDRVTTAKQQPVEVATATVGPLEKLRSKMSPLQWVIVRALSDSTTSLTYDELVAKLGKDKGTIAKQLSRLALVSDVELMKRKGVTEPIVVKSSREGRPVFELAEPVRFVLATK
ncbi:AAA family ATPase [Candidatus Woesearchaeota archaeon]|nr:AAA family ATPase [Candidatus Woesearchaeota archaeon]